MADVVDSSPTHHPESTNHVTDNDILADDAQNNVNREQIETLLGGGGELDQLRQGDFEDGYHSDGPKTSKVAEASGELNPAGEEIISPGELPERLIEGGLEVPGDVVLSSDSGINGEEASDTRSVLEKTGPETLEETVESQNGDNEEKDRNEREEGSRIGHQDKDDDEDESRHILEDDKHRRQNEDDRGRETEDNRRLQDRGESRLDEEATEDVSILQSLPSPVNGTRGSSNPNRGLASPLERTGTSLLVHLPPLVRGQVKGQQMTYGITDALMRNGQPSPKFLIRTRRPAKYIRLSTVTMSSARSCQLSHGPSLYYEPPKRPHKVITWDEATNARPPLRIDMEGPTVWSYSPRNKPLNETNAPAFTFGTKCYPEKDGGSRTAWSKTWFQSSNVWNTKVDFNQESLWPSPPSYPKGSGIGPRQRTMPEAPSFTFGHKRSCSNVRPGAHKEPSPNEYRRQAADKLVLARGPAFTHQLRREGTILWPASEVTPGPAAYSPTKVGREPPAFTIQGIRREKSYLLGPFSPL